MLNPKQLRARAEECEAKAETAYDPDVRRWYRNMAAQWRTLAQQQAEIDIGVRLDMRPRPAAHEAGRAVAGVERDRSARDHKGTRVQKSPGLMHGGRGQ